jgi:hypothetical protein
LDAIEFREEEVKHHGFELRTDGGLLLTDCSRIHLFELPKYLPPSDNRVIDDPIEQGRDCFCRADESPPEELTARPATHPRLWRSQRSVVAGTPAKATLPEK